MTIKKAYYDTLAEFITVLIKIPLMIFCTYYYGLIGAVFALIILEVINFMVISYFINKKIFNEKI